MTREAPEPPGAPGASEDPPLADPVSSGGAPADPGDRLRSLLSVDIGEPTTTPRRRRRGADDAPPPSANGHGAETPTVASSATVAEAPSIGTRTDEASLDVAPSVRPRWRRAMSWVVLVSLLVGGGGLVWAGTSIVRNSTEGQVVAPVDDPTAPGFEALVETTPTMVLMHDVDGSIDSITVLTLPDPAGSGGGVLFVPTRTVFDMPLYELNPVEVAYDLGTADFLGDVTGQLLGAAMNSEVVVDDDRWSELVAPVAPLEIDNTDPIEVDGEVRFPTGDIELEAEDVGAYLQGRVDGESDLARLFRHRTFWNAWLAAVAESDRPDAVPGEVDTGIGRFVRTIAGGTALIETLPVQDAPEGRYGDEPAFVPRFDAMSDLVELLVPLPASSAPGARARARILNGTDDTDRAAAVAPLLTPAGVEIVIVGNAPEFGVERTTITYVADEFRDEAEDIASLLGVGSVEVETRPSDVVDITVTLGADYG